jgi:hypothetical protein
VNDTGCGFELKLPGGTTVKFALHAGPRRATSGSRNGGDQRVVEGTGRIKLVHSEEGVNELEVD